MAWERYHLQRQPQRKQQPQRQRPAGVGVDVGGGRWAVEKSLARQQRRRQREWERQEKELVEEAEEEAAWERQMVMREATVRLPVSQPIPVTASGRNAVGGGSVGAYGGGGEEERDGSRRGRAAGHRRTRSENSATTTGAAAAAMEKRQEEQESAVAAGAAAGALVGRQQTHARPRATTFPDLTLAPGWCRARKEKEAASRARVPEPLRHCSTCGHSFFWQGQTIGVVSIPEDRACTVLLAPDTAKSAVEERPFCSLNCRTQYEFFGPPPPPPAQVQVELPEPISAERDTEDTSNSSCNEDAEKSTSAENDELREDHDGPTKAPRGGHPAGTGHADTQHSAHTQVSPQTCTRKRWQNEVRCWRSTLLV